MAAPFRTPDSMEGNLPEPQSGFQPNITDEGRPTPIVPQTLDSWDRGRATTWTADDAANVFQQLAWQYPQLTAPAIDSAGRQILQMSEQFPEIFDIFAADSAAGLAMTDHQVAQRIADGMPRTELAPLIDAVVQEWMTQGAADVFEVMQKEQNEVNGRRYSALASGQSAEIQQRVLAAHDFGEVSGRGGAEGARPTVSAAGVFSSSLASAPGEWASNGSQLAFKISPIDGPQMQALLDLDEGTVVKTTSDAQFELVRALMGDAHEIVNRQNIPDTPEAFSDLFSRDTMDLIGDAEKSKAGRTILNGLWSNMQLLFNPKKLVTGVETLESVQAERDLSIKEFVDAQIATGEIPEDYAVVAIADLLTDRASDMEIETMGPGGIIEAAQSLFADNKEIINEEYRRSLEADDIMDLLENTTSDDPLSKQIIDNVMGGVLDVIQGWENVVQTLGTHSVAFVEGSWNLVAEDHSLGFDAYRNAFNKAKEAGTVGDYFGLEGSARDAVNIGASFAFDPLNFLFVGPSKSRSFLTDMLSDPKFAPQIIKQRSVRTMINQVATKEGDEGVRAALAMTSGLSSDSIDDLVKIAFGKYDPTLGLEKQIEQILTRNLPSNGGTWMGEVVGRASSRSTVEGVAHLINKWPSLDETTRKKMIQIFGNVDTGRVTDLAEHTFMDNMLELAVVTDGIGTAGLTDRVSALTDAWRSHTGVSKEAKAVARTAEVDTKAQIAEVTREIKSRVAITDGGGVYRVDDLPMVQEAVEKLQRGFDELGGAVPDEVLAQIDDLTSASVTLERFSDDLQAVLKPAHAKTAALQRMQTGMDVPKYKVALIEYVYDFYDDLAKGLDLPLLVRNGQQAMNPFTGREMYDWSVVTGKVGKHLPESADEAAAWMGLAQAPEAQKFSSASEAALKQVANTQDQLKAIGFANKVGRLPLPASPMEIVAYKAGKDNGAIAALQKAARQKQVAMVGKSLRTVFAVNLLLNPVTAFKAHFDEVLRFMVDTGELGQGLRLLAPRRVGEQIGEDVSSWGAAHNRDFRSFLGKHVEDWEMVTPSSTKPAHFNKQVERFLGGTTTKDDGFQAFAKAIVDEDKSVFLDWWESEGKLQSRNMEVKFQGRQGISAYELTGDEAYRIYDNSFQLFLNNGVEEAVQEKLMQRILEAATGGRKLSVATDGALFRGVKKIPGQTHPKEGWGPLTFQALFGSPAERRGSVFFDHYFDWAKNVYTKANTDKILTAKHLMAEGFSESDAGFMLMRGRRDPTVRALLDEHGWTTEAAIETASARYAGRMSDNLMYQLTATSMAGKAAESALLVPFLRAQTDFLGWWWKQVTKPISVRMTPEMRAAWGQWSAAEKMAHPGTALKMATTPLEQIPINFRMLSRYAHIVGATNDDDKSMLDEAIESLTFLPLRMSNEVMLDVAPHPGPIPSFMLDIALSDDSQVREFLEGVFPGLGFTSYEGITDFADAIIPPNSRSWRGIASSLGRWLGAADDAEMNILSQFMQWNRQPYAYSDLLAESAGRWLGENLMTYSPEDGFWGDELTNLEAETARYANSEEGKQRLLRAGVPFIGNISTGESIQNYQGIIDDAPLLLEMGVFLPEDMRDLLGEGGEPGVWQKWQDGDATREEITWIRNKMAAVMFERSDVEIAPGLTVRDYLLAFHPEISANLVSKAQCTEGSDGEFLAPQHCRADGKIDIRETGAAGDEIRKEGFRKGWFEQRGALGTEGWIYEAQTTALSARWRVIKAVWNNATGRDYGELPKSLLNSRVPLTADALGLLEKVGVVNVSEGMRGEDFYLAVKEWEDRYNDYRPAQASRIWENPFVQNLQRLEGGAALVEQMKEFDRNLNKHLNIDYIGDWPEEDKQKIRDEIGRLINQGAGKPGTPTVLDYEKHWERYLGPLDFAPPVLPGLSSDEIGDRVQVSSSELRDGTVEVIDGDGVSVLTKDGPLEIRIIGVNAPERGQDGSFEAAQNLRQFLLNHDNVEFVQWKPDEYGVSHTVTPDGRRRALLWMYVDGVPVFDPSVFTSDNPEGRDIGGAVPDFEGMLATNRGN